MPQRLSPRAHAVASRYWRWPCVALLFGVCLATSTQATDGSEAPSRYAITAELRPLAVSACGRFAIDASARYAPEAKSADGRYALKAVNVPSVGCDPFPDPIFWNGFEAP